MFDLHVNEEITAVICLGKTSNNQIVKMVLYFSLCASSMQVYFLWASRGQSSCDWSVGVLDVFLGSLVVSSGYVTTPVKMFPGWKLLTSPSAYLRKRNCASRMVMYVA